MKSAFLVVCLLSTSLMAKTTVVIPLHIEIDNKIITTAELNKKLNLKSEDKLLENLIVTNDNVSLRTANTTYWAQNAKADELASKLHLNFSMELSDPHGCYKGLVSEAVDIYANLADGPFSDQQGFFGYKYKKETHFIDSQDDEESDKFLNEGSAAWKNWKGVDESILILFHVGDDGDDINEALIFKCN